MQVSFLPEYMRCTAISDETSGKTIKAKNNATQIVNPVTNNSIITRASATTRDAATSLGRGLTAPIIHFDEVEFTPFIDTIVANSFMSFKTAHDNAIKNGVSSSRIFCSTPGDLDSDPGIRSQRLLHGTCPWSETLYDMDDTQIKEYIDAHGNIKGDSNNPDEYNGILYIEYNYKQLKLTNQWLEEVRKGIGDLLTFRREVLLQRLHGSDASPFDRTDIEYIIQIQREPIDELWVN